jgi:hypothetical protein
MDVIVAVEKNDSTLLAQAMTSLIQDANQLGLPKTFLTDIMQGLETGDWSRFAQALKSFEFMGEEGRFFVLAPYTTSRGAKSETRLSALYASRLDLGEIPVTLPILIELFGIVRERIPRIVPIRGHAGAGWCAGEAGEAFLVPNGWAGLCDGDGPVLNNMSEQLARVETIAFEAIKTIFDRPSSELLLSAYSRSMLAATLNAEYSFHEAGHASGIGLSHKLTAGVLNTPFYGAVEEWRADGVAFQVACRSLPVETTGTLVASNLITRLGIDAHRRGALDFDTDVNAALLTFHSIIESGMLKVGHDNRLSFIDPTFSGLVRATELMCASALSLTRRELQLSDPRAIWTLYPNVVAVPESVRHLFCQTVVNPCRGLYRELN